jgi:hypothetical protein
MALTGMLGQSTVSDLDVAVPWYAALFGRDPDARPMPGLVEWHLGEGFGVQVWAEPERAGRSTVVLHEADLAAFVEHLDRSGIEHPVAYEATSFRLVELTDPDGNRVVVTGALNGG